MLWKDEPFLLMSCCGGWSIGCKLRCAVSVIDDQVCASKWGQRLRTMLQTRVDSFISLTLLRPWFPMPSWDSWDTEIACQYRILLWETHNIMVVSNDYLPYATAWDCDHWPCPTMFQQKLRLPPNKVGNISFVPRPKLERLWNISSSDPEWT